MYASDIIKRNRARTVYANYVAQLTQQKGGCGGFLRLDNGWVPDNTLLIELKEGEQFTSVAERDAIVTNFTCPVVSSNGGSAVVPFVPYTYTWTVNSTPTISRWGVIEGDANFTTLAATALISSEQGVYISSDGGTSWTLKSSGISWPVGGYVQRVAVAQNDSTIVYAAVRGSSTGGYLYKSTDSGNTYTALTNPGLQIWMAIGCSGTGSVVLAGDNTTTSLWLSTNGGTTFTRITANPPGTTAQWLHTFVSDNGQVMAAVSVTADIVYSTNGGTTWSSVTGSGGGNTISGSSTGQYMIATRTNSKPLLTTNSGSSWAAVSSLPTAIYRGCGVSSTGQVMIVAFGEFSAGGVYISQDFGSTWTLVPSATGVTYNVEGCTLSGDGSKALAGAASGQAGGQKLAIGIGIN
jgi:hypothetical protein